jgi:alpha-tubulin suppressor-like RCC1 family protein
MRAPVHSPLRRSTVGITALAVAGAFAGAIAVATPALAASGPAGVPLGWGINNTGQLGNGTTQTKTDANPTPAVSNLPASAHIVAIAAGSAHTLAIDSDGTVYAWGDNTLGELGNGTVTSSNVPVPVSVPAGVTFTAVSAGFGSSMALSSDGHVYTWGYNNVGQLGNGSTVLGAGTPVEASLPADAVVTAISAGYAHDMALTSDGKVYAWGDNSQGELGDNTTTSHNTPIQVALVGNVLATGISAGYLDSVAVLAGGKANAWGYNLTGELGNGNVTTQHHPVAVALPAGVSVTTVAAGLGHTLALSTTGSLVSWGANNLGQLGTGNPQNAAVPTQFHLPGGISATSIASGAANSYALDASGDVYSWGDNSVGELGTGSTTPATSRVPVLATLPAGAHAIAISSSHSSEDAFVLAQGFPTTTTVSSSLNPAGLGSAVTFTATVSGGDNGGSVSFTSDGTAISGCGAVPVGSDGTAACTTSALAEGTHAIEADYSGDDIYTESSGTLTGGEFIIPATKLTAAPVSIVGSILHLKLTYSATLTDASSGSPVPGEKVSFAPNPNLLSAFTAVGSCSATTDAHGVASCSVNVLNVVPGLLATKYTATFVGDDQWGGSTGTGTISLP